MDNTEAAATYRTWIWDQLFECLSERPQETDNEIGRQRIEGREKWTRQRGKDKLSIRTTTIPGVVFVYSTSAAVRSGDEEPGRDFIPVTDHNLAAFRKCGVDLSSLLKTGAR